MSINFINGDAPDARKDQTRLNNFRMGRLEDEWGQRLRKSVQDAFGLDLDTLEYHIA